MMDKSLSAVIKQILFHMNKLAVILTNGHLIPFQRDKRDYYSCYKEYYL